MIELPAMDSVALSLHHAPGVYALLVGSGLSTAAGIPTGWDITLELVRRLAVLQGVEDQKTPDQWEQWYVETYGGPPSYSELVGKVAQTADERRNILHDFIEPREGEEARRPGKAHEAIAKLVASGAVKVIITTNFDRLIETALKGAGVEPTVIASDDAVQGATPIVHSRCTVIKVHGDYLDARIRNTDEELAGYSEPMNRLLGQVFDAFGLIVAGWSATWDTALCDAIRRARSLPRYSLYWAHRGALTQHASDIVEARGGRTIEIPDADSFFGKLVDSVEVLARSSKPHPQSTELALQLAKKYCRDDKYDAEWAEFIFQEIKSIKSFVESIDCNQPRSNEEKSSLLWQFVERTEILRKSALICGRWGTFNAKKLMFEKLLDICYRNVRPNGILSLLLMRDFGFGICCYWMIAGIINSDEWVLLKNILTTDMNYDGRNTVAVEVIPLTLYRIDWTSINEYENHLTPISGFVFNLFKTESEVISLTPEKSEFLFDEVEMILAIQFHHVAPNKKHFCLGRFAWKEQHDKLLSRYDNLDKNSPILQSGLFGGTPENVSAAVRRIRDDIR